MSKQQKYSKYENVSGSLRQHLVPPLMSIIEKQKCLGMPNQRCQYVDYSARVLMSAKLSYSKGGTIYKAQGLLCVNLQAAYGTFYFQRGGLISRFVGKIFRFKADQIWKVESHRQYFKDEEGRSLPAEHPFSSVFRKNRTPPNLPNEIRISNDLTLSQTKAQLEQLFRAKIEELRDSKRGLFLSFFEGNLNGRALRVTGEIHYIDEHYFLKGRVAWGMPFGEFNIQAKGYAFTYNTYLAGKPLNYQNLYEQPSTETQMRLAEQQMKESTASTTASTAPSEAGMSPRKPRMSQRPSMMKKLRERGLLEQPVVEQRTRMMSSSKSHQSSSSFSMSGR